jgi:hypothetical protein
VFGFLIWLAGKWKRGRIGANQEGIAMSVYYGVIRDRVVVLSGDAPLVEGQRVEVRILDRKRARARSGEEAFQQHLLKIGLLSETRSATPVQAIQERKLVEVTGKPLSQIIIEERR